MQERQTMSNSPQQAGFEAFLARTGLTQEQALGLLEAAWRKQSELAQRARQVMDAIEAIGDDRFTVEALRGNPEALRAVEEGAPVGEIYRRFFLRRALAPQEETEANLGLAGLGNDVLTPEEIERISQYVARTGQRYEMN